MKQLTGIKLQNIRTAHAAQYQKNPKQLSQKMADDLNRHFSKEARQMTRKHMKRFTTLLIIKEMQIKTIRRHHLTPIRMAITKESTNNKSWRGCGEKRTLLHYWWECKLVQPLGRTVWTFLKKMKIELPYDLAIPHQAHIQRKNRNLERCTYPNVHSRTIYSSQDLESTKCPSTEECVKKMWDNTQPQEEWQRPTCSNLITQGEVRGRQISYDIYRWNLSNDTNEQFYKIETNWKQTYGYQRGEVEKGHKLGVWFNTRHHYI